MMGIDPVFLKKIEYLKEKKPQNYQYREINLFTDEDVINQEIKFQGNVLDVGEISIRANPIYIRFNEILNDAILLKEGIYLFDFYRIFLTFQHAGEPCSVTLIASKDLIKINYPARIQKPFDLIYPYEKTYIDSMHVGAIKYIYGYNQIRGLATNDSDSEQKMWLFQYAYKELFGEAKGASICEIIIPANSQITFIIDLIGGAISWTMLFSGVPYNLGFFANLWCI